jgi:hypothetical protein
MRKLYILIIPFLIIQCAVKKTTTTAATNDNAKVSAPTGDVKLNAPPSLDENTRKMLETAEIVEHGATQYWLKQGEGILKNQCASCHGYKDPTRYDEASWVKHMNRMVPKAKLSEEQAKFLRVYTITQIRTKQ